MHNRKRALTWNGSLPARAIALGLNSHSSPVGSFHSYGSEHVTSEMRSFPTMLHDCARRLSGLEVGALCNGKVSRRAEHGMLAPVMRKQL